MEIKRNFIVTRIPNINLEGFNPTNIKQGYLITDEVEIKIKNIEDKYYFNVKGNDNQIKENVGYNITDEEQFIKIKDEFNISLIEKTRYQIPLTAKLIIELDIYHNELEGLKIAELRFDNEKEANSFTPLTWFGEEFTYDSNYKNKNLVNKTYNDAKTYKKEL